MDPKCITSRLLPMLFLAVLLTGFSGCSPSASSRHTRTSSDEIYSAGNEDEQADEEYEEEPDTEDAEEANRRRYERSLSRREREHRQSMQNMGSWLVSVLIGIGVNVLLAVMFWS